MIEVKLIEVMGIHGAMKGMRNPKDSWKMGDSDGMRIGENDLGLAKRLVKSGTDHRKFMRMIHVQMDIKAPFYWWKEFDTYKVGTTSNSCSTMHRITSKPITMDDFSMDDFAVVDDAEVGTTRFSDLMKAIVESCEFFRQRYLETKDARYWRALIQELPCSYNQLRTVDVDYETLMRMYQARKHHKLVEWHELCDFIKCLPYMGEFLECERGDEE